MKQNPWRGLAAYVEPRRKDKFIYKFCGRELAIRELSQMIENNLFVTLYGRTGIGKTSLLKAGIFPVLRNKQYLPVVVRFNMADEDINESFAEQIVSAIENTINDIRPFGKIDIQPLDSEGIPRKDYLWEYFATRRFYANKKEVFPLVVLDQFEENFLKYKEDTYTLMEQLYSLVDDNKLYPKGYHNETIFRLLVSIREDDLCHLEDCIEQMHLYDFKFNRYRVVQFSETEVKEIIEIPGKEYLPINEDERKKVVDEIIEVVKQGNDGSINTLVLSLVCSELFNNIVVRQKRKQINPGDVKTLSDNPLLDFYMTLPLRNKTRYYLEKTFIDSNGRRNSVNQGVLDKEMPEWRELSDGSSRILQTTNNKVELVHDMLAKAIYDVRTYNEKNKKKGTLKKIILGITLILFVVSSLESVFDFQGRDEERVPVFYQEKIVTGESLELRGYNLTKRLVAKVRHYLKVVNFCRLQHVNVQTDNESGCSVTIEKCPNLTSLDIQGNATYITITNCPSLKSINLNGTIIRIRINGESNIVKIIPKDQLTYKWLDGVLWNIKDQSIVYAKNHIRKAAFPYELRIYKDRLYEGEKIENTGLWIDNLLFSSDSTRIITYHSPLDSVLDLNKYPRLRYIEEGGFANCKEIKKVIMPDSLEIYYFKIFKNCSQLDTVDIRKYTDDYFKLPQLFAGTGTPPVYLLDSISGNYKNRNGIVFQRGVPLIISGESQQSLYVDNRPDSIIVLTKGMSAIKDWKIYYITTMGWPADYTLPPFELSDNNLIFYRSNDNVYSLGTQTYLGNDTTIFVKDIVYDLWCDTLPRELRQININSNRFKQFIGLEDSIRRNITLKIPYGQRNRFIGDGEFWGFKEIREKTLWETVTDNLYCNVLLVEYSFSRDPWLLLLVTMGVLFSGIFTGYVAVKKTLTLTKNPQFWILKFLFISISSMLIIGVSWTGVYWFVWYTFFNATGSGVCSAVIATLFSIVCILALYYNILDVMHLRKWISAHIEMKIGTKDRDIFNHVKTKC